MNYLIQYSIYPSDKRIEEHLNNLKIKYNKSSGTKGEFIIFYIYDTDGKITEIQKLFSGENKLLVNNIYYPKYTEEEIKKSMWIDIRCVTSKIDPTNDGDAEEVTCVFDRSRTGIDIGHHRLQARPLEIRRTFKWGNSQFFSGSITTGGLFCDDRAVSLMEHAGLRGIQYGPVLKWQTGTPIPNLHQVIPDHVIPNGAFVPIRDMEPYTCELCGMQMLRISGQKFLYGIRSTLLAPEIDFYKTLPLFLDYSAKRYSGGREHCIISQRAYQVLKKNKMCRGMEFTPLTLVP